jgi:hypothetical protein
MRRQPIVSTNDTEEVQPKVKWSTKTESLLFRREFLNQPDKGSSAHILARVAEISEFKDDILTEKFIDTELSISDCNNKIHLNLGVSKENFDNTIYKLNKLIEVLTQVKDTILKNGPNGN